MQACNDPGKGFPVGYMISHGLPSCVGLTRQPLCGLDAAAYFGQLVHWLLAAQAGDHSQKFPDCLGSVPVSYGMAQLDSLALPGQPFGEFAGHHFFERTQSSSWATVSVMEALATRHIIQRDCLQDSAPEKTSVGHAGPPGALPSGQQAELLQQINAAVWPTLYSILEEQDSALLQRYALSEETLYLIGQRGATPAWSESDSTDPLGRTINLDCCAALLSMSESVCLLHSLPFTVLLLSFHRLSLSFCCPHRSA